LCKVVISCLHLFLFWRIVFVVLQFIVAIRGASLREICLSSYKGCDIKSGMHRVLWLVLNGRLSYLLHALIFDIICKYLMVVLVYLSKYLYLAVSYISALLGQELLLSVILLCPLCSQVPSSFHYS
jgi:hypothetical protein